MISHRVVEGLELLPLVSWLTSVLVASLSWTWLQGRDVEACWTATRELHGTQIMLLEARL